MAIVLDNEVTSAPNLNGKISDRGIIMGGQKGFTSEELKNLSTVLASGSLRVSPTQMSKATIGPTLGETSISRGVLAGILAGGLVLGFVAIFYLSTGFIAAIALIIGVYVLIGGLGFLDATLTLPGIAGILLTLGMAVDQNILINERIREERDKGKTLAQSVKNGFERAFVTIIDAQATTFIAGFILYQYGTGPIKGFAVTLMLGIVTTMFASLVGSKTIFAIGLEREWFKSLRMMSIIGKTEIAFTKYLRPCLAVSALMLLGGMSAFAIHYDDMKGIDFAGGFQAHVRLKDPVTPEDMRTAISTAYPSAQIVSMSGTEGSRSGPGGATTDYQIKIRTEGTGDASAEASTETPNDQRLAYIDNIRTALGDKMLPDAISIDGGALSSGGDGRTAASFTLHFTKPVPTTLIEGRLKEAVVVRSVTPAGGGDDTESASFVVDAILQGSALDQDSVRAAVAPTLANLPDNARLSDPVPESTFIGGKVGKELRNSAIKAIFVAIIAILIYIRVRFHDVNYGIAACVAVAHDVLFCLGMATLAHWVGLVTIELDLAMIGAFLTIIGYSLNDTIVIFDRVRENLPRVNKPLEEVVDLSINQTLSRTLLTSLTTIIAVGVLFLLNYGQGNVLEGFAFVMLCGILVGTYSTIYIASPILVWLTRRSETQRAAARAAAASA